MTSKKLFLVLVLAVVLMFVALIGGAYVANTLLAQYSKKVVDKRAKIQELQQQEDSLTQAKKDVAKYQPLADIAKSIVPQDKNQAQTIQEIVNIATANGIDLGSITFPSSSLGDVKSGSAPASGSTAAPAPAANTALSQLTPVKDIPGVYSLQIVISPNPQKPITYDRFISFLEALERNRRTALVSNISITPDKTISNALSFTLTLDEYVKP